MNKLSANGYKGIRFFTSLIEIKHMIIYSQSPASLHRASPLVDGQSVRGVIGPRDSQRPIAALPRPSLSRCRRWRGGSARAVIGGISCEWRAAGRRVEVRVPGGWERGRCPHESRSWNAVVRHRGRWGAGSCTPCSWRSPLMYRFTPHCRRLLARAWGKVPSEFQQDRFFPQREEIRLQTLI